MMQQWVDSGLLHRINEKATSRVDFFVCNRPDRVARKHATRYLLTFCQCQRKT